MPTNSTWRDRGPEAPAKRFVADTFVPPVIPPPSPSTWQFPDTLVINTGAIEAGGIADLVELDDVELILDENTGTPGFSYDFQFGNLEAVPSFNLYLNFHGFYSGNLGHNVKIQQYNYVSLSFVDITANPGDIPDSAETTYQFTLIAQALYVSNGKTVIRIIHTSSGNPNHRLHLDQMYLSLV
jgi:hypothetical protein